MHICSVRWVHVCVRLISAWRHRARQAGADLPRRSSIFPETSWQTRRSRSGSVRTQCSPVFPLENKSQSIFSSNAGFGNWSANRYSESHPTERGSKDSLQFFLSYFFLPQPYVFHRFFIAVFQRLQKVGNIYLVDTLLFDDEYCRFFQHLPSTAGILRNSWREGGRMGENYGRYDGGREYTGRVL